jgi:hypothetical protein
VAVASSQVELDVEERQGDRVMMRFGGLTEGGETSCYA